MNLKPSEEKVWRKFYSPEALAQTVPEKTVYGYLKERSRDHLEQTAINYYGAKYSYKQLFENIDQAANAFSALGVKQGDLVCFVSVGIPETIYAIYALNKLGATANMIDPRMDISSIRKMIRNSGSTITLIIDLAFPKLAKVIDDVNQKHIVVQSPARSLTPVKRAVKGLFSKEKIPFNDTIVNWDRFLSYGKGSTAVEAPYVGDATVAITFTGGTTGFPKGVMLTNDSMNAVSLNFRYAGLATYPGDSFLGIIPVFTSYGMVCGMHMPLTYGFELIPIPKFIPTKLGKLMRQFKPNNLISTPAFYEMMMDSKEVKNLDLSFLMSMGSGGDTMNEGLEHKLDAFMKAHKIPYPLAQGYGMSEVSAAASFCFKDIYKAGSVGIPSVMTVIGIFDPETGEELDYNQEGEICITGPTMMKGYYRSPEETAHVMRKHKDGTIWVHSGDIGYLDEEGFLFVKGRIKRMITRFDGHKVFPVTIESLVSEHPEVHSCCVVGVDDREHNQGQYPLVIIEVPETADRAGICRMIYDECQQELEERGRPVAVLPMTFIPLTGSGKNDFRTLEKEYSTYDYTKWDPAVF